MSQYNSLLLKREIVQEYLEEDTVQDISPSRFGHLYKCQSKSFYLFESYFVLNVYHLEFFQDLLRARYDMIIYVTRRGPL